MARLAISDEYGFPLLKLPFLFPPAAYSFIEARVEELNLAKSVQLLLIWICRCLIDMVLGIIILGALDLEDHLTSGRSKKLRYLLPEAPPLQTEKTTYTMQASPIAPTPPPPSQNRSRRKRGGISRGSPSANFVTRAAHAPSPISGRPWPHQKRKIQGWHSK